MKRDYKINSHNSTVCGYPGRNFDWSKFDWEGKEKHDFGDARYATDSDFVPKKKRGRRIGIDKSPGAWVDDSWFKSGHYVYLHVPFNYAEDGTVYRVRANNCMYPDSRYRGHVVKELRAVKKEDGWYWRLEFEREI